MANEPCAKAEMLIRKPVSEVFNAFMDPEVTSRFWFTRGSGKLREGETINWEWEMYGFSIPVNVRAIEENRRILIDWPEGDDKRTQVEWAFQGRPDGSTFVSITNSGFTGDDAERVEQAIASTEGFAFVLAGLKAYLEHDVQLNLVADRFPEAPGA